MKDPVNTALTPLKVTCTTRVPVMVLPEMEPVFVQSDVSKLKLTADSDTVPFATTPVGICCTTGPRGVVHVRVPPAYVPEKVAPDCVRVRTVPVELQLAPLP